MGPSRWLFGSLVRLLWVLVVVAILYVVFGGEDQGLFMFLSILAAFAILSGVFFPRRRRRSRHPGSAYHGSDGGGWFDGWGGGDGGGSDGGGGGGGDGGGGGGG